jgi:anti-anti-sigma regulatory factor
MVVIAKGWELDVERGPDWLFVRPHRLSDDADAEPSLAAGVWALLEQNFSHNLVLELDQIEQLNSHMIGQLIWLHNRIRAHDGLMRVSGLNDSGQDALRLCRLDSRFPSFLNRTDAVHGYRPMQPR